MNEAQWLKVMNEARKVSRIRGERVRVNGYELSPRAQRIMKRKWEYVIMHSQRGV